jgi:polar amino acid transport system permease protein
MRANAPGSRNDRRASKGVRAGVVGTLSTTVVFALLAVAVSRAPGWPKVHAAFFAGKHFRASFPKILSGFWLNVRLFIIAEICVLILALAVAVIRTIPGPALFPARLLATAYTDIFRGVPTILLIYLFGFGVPQMLGLSAPWNSPLLWGSVALILNYGAYVAEVFRAGIRSVHPSQMAAARSLGLSQRSGLRYVIVPQALRRVVPPVLNDFVALQKDTALVAILGPLEAFRQTQIYQAKTFNFTSYLGAAVLFLLLTIPLARITDWLISREEQHRR